MVRKGPWKLCYYGAYDSDELFNLETDPEELQDRIHDPSCSAVIEELRAEIFSDGWNRDIYTQVWERQNHFGEMDNVKAYRDALRASISQQPRHVALIDYWEGSHQYGDFLDPEFKSDV